MKASRDDVVDARGIVASVPRQTIDAIAGRLDAAGQAHLAAALDRLLSAMHDVLLFADVTLRSDRLHDPAPHARRGGDVIAFDPAGEAVRP